MGFTLANLKQSCRALELPVTGLKADLVHRLASAQGKPTANQVEEVKKLRQAALARGIDYTLSASHLRSRESTRVWLSGAQAELAMRHH
jgi:hypothetical protein